MVLKQKAKDKMTKMFFNKMKAKAGLNSKYNANAKILDNHLKTKYENKEIWNDQELEQNYSDCSETSFDKYYKKQTSFNSGKNLSISNMLSKQIINDSLASVSAHFANHDDIIDLSKVFHNKKPQIITDDQNYLMKFLEPAVFWGAVSENLQITDEEFDPR